MFVLFHISTSAQSEDWKYEIVLSTSLYNNTLHSLIFNPQLRIPREHYIGDVSVHVMALWLSILDLLYLGFLFLHLLQNPVWLEMDNVFNMLLVMSHRNSYIHTLVSGNQEIRKEIIEFVNSVTYIWSKMNITFY